LDHLSHKKKKDENEEAGEILIGDKTVLKNVGNDLPTQPSKRKERGKRMSSRVKKADKIIEKKKKNKNGGKIGGRKGKWRAGQKNHKDGTGSRRFLEEGGSNFHAGAEKGNGGERALSKREG